MKLFSNILDILYPNICNHCKKRVPNKTDFFCIQCFGRFEKTNFHKIEENLVLKRFEGIIPLKAATSFLYINEGNMASQIMHEFKYHKNIELAEYMGKWYGQELKNSVFDETDLLIPIPLHKNKKAIRGYNQSMAIANGIGSILNIEAKDDVIIRNKFTVSQTKLSKSERQKNVENVFEVVKKEFIIHKRITLIDDVVTTGATIEMCAKELLKFPIKSLNVITLGFAYSD
jgi:ComF family protein